MFKKNTIRKKVDEAINAKIDAQEEKLRQEIERLEADLEQKKEDLVDLLVAEIVK